MSGRMRSGETTSKQQERKGDIRTVRGQFWGFWGVPTTAQDRQTMYT